MAFVTDKEVLKPGLIIFRRADVDHRNWYCRVKLPKADRYKTVSLKTYRTGVTGQRRSRRAAWSARSAQAASGLLPAAAGP